MNYTKYYIETTRPKTLIASFAPIALIAAFHFDLVIKNLGIYFALLIATISLQILTNYFNDFFDLIQGFDTDLRKGPKRPFQRGDLTRNEMKKGIFFFSFLYLFSSIPLILRLGPFGITFVALCYGLAIFYTKGPYSLSKLGLSDFFSFSFFGPIATGVSGYILTGNLSINDFILGLFTGSLSTILLVINHLRDEIEDRLNNKTTSVVRFGSKFGKFLIYILINLVRITPIYLFKIDIKSSFIIILILFFSSVFIRNFQRCNDPIDFANLLPKAALHFLIQTAIFIGLCGISVHR